MHQHLISQTKINRILQIVATSLSLFISLCSSPHNFSHQLGFCFLQLLKVRKYLLALARCNILIKLPREGYLVTYLGLLLVYPCLRRVGVNVLLHILLYRLAPWYALGVSLACVGCWLALLQHRLAGVVAQWLLYRHLAVLEILVLLNLHLHFKTCFVSINTVCKGLYASVISFMQSSVNSLRLLPSGFLRFTQHFEASISCTLPARSADLSLETIQM